MSDITDFKDLKFNRHTSLGVRIAKVAYNNGYGASVLYDGGGLYEVATLWRGAYEGGIQHQTPEEVSKELLRIASLPDDGWRFTYLRLDALLEETSKENWDLERGVPIEKEYWEKARLFLKDVEQRLPHVPPPFLSPCGDGCIHIEWFGKGDNRATAVLEVCKGSGYRWTRLGSWTEENGWEKIHEPVALNTLEEAFYKVQHFYSIDAPCVTG